MGKRIQYVINSYEVFMPWRFVEKEMKSDLRYLMRTNDTSHVYVEVRSFRRKKRAA